MRLPAMPRLTRCIRYVLVSPPFTKYLLGTNVLFGGAIDFCGDFVTQRIIEKSELTDWERSRRMVIVSLTLGVPAHYWYLNLDRWFPLQNRRHVVKKILLDTFGGGPFFIAGFFLGMSLLEGKAWKASVEEVKVKFAPAFMLDVIFWPLLQGVNFYFMPTSLRLVFANCGSFLWSIALSTLKHNDLEFLKPSK